MPTRIVIIDDDKVTRLLLTERLSREGFVAFPAPDGASGLDLVHRERPDLVLTDLLIPLVDGIEVCRRIKNDPDLRNTRVVVMSAMKNMMLIREVKAAGADDFVEKPFQMEVLFDLLRRLAPKAGEPSSLA